MSSAQSIDPRPPTPAFGVPSVPPVQAIPPEFQAALTAAQNSLPPWARWVFAVAIGPLLLTTYNEAKIIWGVPEAQKGINTRLDAHDSTLETLVGKVDSLTVSVDKIADRISYMNFAPASSRPASQPKER